VSRSCPPRGSRGSSRRRYRNCCSRKARLGDVALSRRLSASSATIGAHPHLCAADKSARAVTKMHVARIRHDSVRVPSRDTRLATISASADTDLRSRSVVAGEADAASAAVCENAGRTGPYGTYFAWSRRRGTSIALGLGAVAVASLRDRLSNTHMMRARSARGWRTS
jgi:hypothetical protein